MSYFKISLVSHRLSVQYFLNIFAAAQPLIVANNVTATEGETAILRCSVGVNIALYPDLLIYLARETPLTVSANNRCEKNL